MLGVAAELIERFGFEITKNRMIAQQSERTPCHGPGHNIFVLGYAAHDHLMICVVRHPRDQAIAHGLSIGRRRYTPARWLQQEMAADLNVSAIGKTFDLRLILNWLLNLEELVIAPVRKPQKLGAAQFTTRHAATPRGISPAAPGRRTGLESRSTPKGRAIWAAQTVPSAPAGHLATGAQFTGIADRSVCRRELRSADQNFIDIGCLPGQLNQSLWS